MSFICYIFCQHRFSFFFATPTLFIWHCIFDRTGTEGRKSKNNTGKSFPSANLCGSAFTIRVGECPRSVSERDQATVLSRSKVRNAQQVGDKTQFVGRDLPLRDFLLRTSSQVNDMFFLCYRCESGSVTLAPRSNKVRSSAAFTYIIDGGKSRLFFAIHKPKLKLRCLSYLDACVSTASVSRLVSTFLSVYDGPGRCVAIDQIEIKLLDIPEGKAVTFARNDGERLRYQWVACCDWRLPASGWVVSNFDFL